MQILNSNDFLQYFLIIIFTEDKEEEGRTEDEDQGEEEEDRQGELREEAIEVNLLLHLAKVQ